jgi:predicted metal-dependent hydrolase
MTPHLQQASSLVDDDRYQQAVSLFNAHDWYAAHDAFEELWHEAAGEDRLILQGVIQIAVAEHHLSNGNQRGSLLLMAEGLNHIQSSAPHDLGLNLQSLMAVVGRRLASLQAGETLAELLLPRLERIVPNKV